MLLEFAKLGLVHIGAIVAVTALTFRNQLWLRGCMICSTLIYITYYLVVPDVPLWGAIFWSVVMIGVNAFMMTRIMLDRTEFRLSVEEQRLAAAFGTLSPGEFRTLIAQAEWRTAETQQILTREGAQPDKLYYVLDGALGIAKGGRSFPIGAGTFIGEIAFLRGTPASATVTLEPGARYVEWRSIELSRLLDRNAGLKTALDGLFNADMAAKVAQA